MVKPTASPLKAATLHFIDLPAVLILASVLDSTAALSMNSRSTLSIRTATLPPDTIIYLIFGQGRALMKCSLDLSRILMKRGGADIIQYL